MKIYISCECPILQRAFELFLDEYIVPYEQASFVISDIKATSEKPLFLIGANSPYLDLPFSKEALMEILSEYDFALKNYSVKTISNDDRDLEDKVIRLIDEFKREILELIRRKNDR